MSRIATCVTISAPVPAGWIWTIIITGIITAMTTATTTAMTMITGTITTRIRMPITRLVLNRSATASHPTSPVDDGRLWGAI